MSSIKPKFDYFIGLFIGLLIVNQAIRAITYSNFIGLFYFALLIIYFYLLISRYRIFQIYLNQDDKIIFILYIAILIYALFTLFETGSNNFRYILELVALFFIYIVGRTITLKSYYILLKVVLFIGFIESFLLIFNRGYIYSSDVNYLLLSLTVGIYTSLSLLFIIFSKNLFSKIYFSFLYIVGLLALFNMQSRTVFIFVILYSLVVPFFLMTYKNRLKVIGIVSVILLVISTLYLEAIIDLYDNAVIYKRMFDLVYNFQDEPRFLTYGLYFEKISQFFFTGYGVNGTELGIYSNTIEKYPHNFILGFISDFGILGFLFSAFFIFRSLYLISKNVKNNLYIITIFTLYLYYLVNFMKSFSIYDSYILFFSIGLVFNKKLFFDINKRKSSV